MTKMLKEPRASGNQMPQPFEEERVISFFEGEGALCLGRIVYPMEELRATRR